jgi:hypothetical protein
MFYSMEGIRVETMPLPQQIARMDADRLRRYRENFDFYHGRQWPGSASGGRRRERRLTFNYARAVIDKITLYRKQLASGQARQRHR